MSGPRGRYRIRAVAEMTGITAATLRAWERRYCIPAPSRTASAYRIYSDDDVQMIRRVVALCEGGMSPSEAARAVLDTEAKPAAAAPVELFNDELSPVRHAIIDAVMRFDARALDRQLNDAATRGPAATIVEHVLRPVMIEVGTRWKARTLSVAHEHFASEAIGNLVRRMLAMVQPDGDARVVLLAGFADDQHLFAMQAAGVYLASAKWRVVLLGPRMPPDALRHAVENVRPDVVGLSCTIPPARQRARTLAQGYAEAAGGVPWLVGGQGAAKIASFVRACGGHVFEGTEAAAVRAAIDAIAAATHTGPKSRR